MSLRLTFPLDACREPINRKNLAHVFAAQAAALVVYGALNAGTIAGGAWFGPVRWLPRLHTSPEAPENPMRGANAYDSRSALSRRKKDAL